MIEEMMPPEHSTISDMNTPRKKKSQLTTEHIDNQHLDFWQIELGCLLEVSGEEHHASCAIQLDAEDELPQYITIGDDCTNSTIEETEDDNQSQLMLQLQDILRHDVEQLSVSTAEVATVNPPIDCCLNNDIRCRPKTSIRRSLTMVPPTARHPAVRKGAQSRPRPAQRLEPSIRTSFRAGCMTS